MPTSEGKRGFRLDGSPFPEREGSNIRRRWGRRGWLNKESTPTFASESRSRGKTHRRDGIVGGGGGGIIGGEF